MQMVRAPLLNSEHLPLQEVFVVCTVSLAAVQNHRITSGPEPETEDSWEAVLALAFYHEKLQLKAQEPHLTSISAG